MIIIFGFLILLILIILIYLSRQGKIHKNTPVIFIIAILVGTPFLYLARNKTNEEIESFANFYNNNNDPQKSDCGDCPGMCVSKEKDFKKFSISPVQLIDNPVQSRIVSKKLSPVKVTVTAASGSQGGVFSAVLTAVEKGKTKTARSSDSNVYVIAMTTDDLLAFAENPRKSTVMDNMVTVEPYANTFAARLIAELELISPDSFIIIGTCGNDLTGLLNSPPKYVQQLADDYSLSMITQLENGASYAAILYKRDSATYNNISQEIASKRSTSGVLLDNINLIQSGESYQIVKRGKEFKNVKKTEMYDYYALPFVRSQYVYIKPAELSQDLSLVFTSENNKGFVYLSGRQENETNPIYSQTDPKKDKSSTNSITYLDNNMPQKWTIIPVYKSEYNETFYIRTFNKPYYYLEADISVKPPKIKTSLYQSGASQYFVIKPVEGDSSLYTIKNVITNLIMGYSNTGGYLYKDTAAVELVDSGKYTWKFKASAEKKPNYTPSNFTPKFLDFSSPLDFPTVNAPTNDFFQSANRFLSSLSTTGRSPWNEYYVNVWNGNWIYYGTIATYGQNQSIENTKFLNINMNSNGEGSATDGYLGFTIPIKNAGCNLLFGFIDSGKLRGFMAVFEMIPVTTIYGGPENTYPIKMRYYIYTGSTNVYNLSGGDINNLNTYSVKFDGQIPSITNFLEMTGVMTTVNPQQGLGFPN